MRRLILLVAVPLLLDTAVVCALAIPTRTPPASAAGPEAVSQHPLPATPPGAKLYPVFFDWDQASLTPQATAVLRAAGRDAVNGQPARIALLSADGPLAPDAGPSHRIYSRALAQAREHEATAELLRDGVDASRIEVAGGVIDLTGPAPSRLALNQ